MTDAVRGVRTPRRRRRDARGAVAVEFALVLCPLVMLLLGTVTTGYSLSQALGVTNAVREGARYGATADGSAASWSTDVLSRVRTTQFDPSASATSICVQLWKHGTGTIKSGCDVTTGPALTMPSITSFPAEPSGVPNGQCVVRVIAARDYTINLVIFGSITRTMTRGAVARYEGTC